MQWLIGHWVFMLFLLLCIFIYPFRATNGFTAIPGDLIDPRFNSFILEHIYQWATNHNVDLWSPKYFYPYKNTLGFSDTFFGNAWVYIIARLVGASRESALIFWFSIAVFANYCSAYFTFSRLKFSQLSSVCAALFYSCALPALSATEHLQLTYRFAIPLAFLFLYQFLNDRELKHLLLMAVFLEIQLLCSPYSGIFLCLLLFSSAIGCFLILPKNFLSFFSLKSVYSIDKKLVFIIGVLISLTILIVYEFSNYYLISRTYQLSAFKDQIVNMLPQPWSYFTSDQVGYVAKLFGYHFLPTRHEHQLYIGIFAIIAIIFSTISVARNPRKNALEFVSLFSLLFLAALTLNINGCSFYLKLSNLPVFESLRGISRIILVLLLPISILVAFFCENLIYSCKKYISSRIFIVGVVLLLCIATEPLLFRFKYHSIEQWQSRVESIKSLVRPFSQSDSIVFIKPKNGEIFTLSELDSMLATQDLGLATINAYSGNFPPGYRPYDSDYGARDRLENYVHTQMLDQVAAQELEGRLLVLPSEASKFQQLDFRPKLGHQYLISSRAPNSRDYLTLGWEAPEVWGSWASSRRTILTLPTPEQPARYLELTLNALITPKQPTIELHVYSDKVLLASTVLKKPEDNRIRFMLPTHALIENTPFIVLDFVVEKILSPKELGMNQDSRMLSFGIVSFKYQ